MFDHNQMDFLSAEAKAIVLKGGFARSVAITPNIMLVVGNYASKPYGEEENAIIRRFSIVFEQSYTRFLDLQKAEAQAREAQIEAALERVRARTMAMQKSDELGDTASLLFRQLNDLGLKSWTAGFNIWSEDNLSYIDWMASPQGGFMEPYVLNLTPGFPVFKECEARNSGVDFYVFDLSGNN